MFIIVSTRQKAVVGQGHGGYQNKLSRDKRWGPAEVGHYLARLIEFDICHHCTQ